MSFLTYCNAGYSVYALNNTMHRMFFGQPVIRLLIKEASSKTGDMIHSGTLFFSQTPKGGDYV